MSNTDTDDDTVQKRNAIAKREWINDAGERVPAGSPEAVGFRYTFLASGAAVDYMVGDAGKLATMFGVMGGLTKVGNIVNSIVNADDYDGSDPMPTVREWLEQADAGVWREISEGGGGRGPKYDKDVLAGALLAVLGSRAQGDVAHYRERLDDRSYYAKVRANTDVMAQYYKDIAEKGGSAGAPDSSALA